MRQTRVIQGAIIVVMMLAAFAARREALAATEQDQASTAVLMQGFHWNSSGYASPNWYGVLAGKAVDMKDLGVTHVWFPPPSDASSSQGYLPRKLNVLSSNYGSEADLVAATSALNAQGIKSIADIVINHRVGTTDWGDFTEPTWDCRAVVSNDEWTGKCGTPDSGDGYDSARDLDHSQTFVQDDLKTWMNTRLKANAGFTGIRFDYSKGYAASYAKIYHDNWNPNFCVGEIWTNLDYNDVNAHRQLLMNYINGTGGTCAAFDFTTKGLLNKALTDSEYWRLKDSGGKPAGAIGWWAQKSVTFVDNHDTGPSESCGVGQNHWPVPCASVMQGYAYILTHPGIPTVYYPHVYDWNLRDHIRTLISIRKAAGITSTSAVSIQAAQTGLYAAKITGTVNEVAMKIGPNSWDPGTGWILAAFGTNYAVWTKRAATAVDGDKLGARYDATGDNIAFRVYSSRASLIRVYIYSQPAGVSETVFYDMTLDSVTGIWSKTVPVSTLQALGITGTVYYGYRAWGPNWPYDAGWSKGTAVGFRSHVDAAGNRFNPNKLLLDPYAFEVTHDPNTPWSNDGTIYASGNLHYLKDSGMVAPKGVVLGADATSFGTKPTRPLKDDIVYEVHVRGLTKGDASILEAERGTYKGAGQKAAYLKALGVTAVEFLPLHETQNDTNDASPYSTDGDNYWGYMTLNYFAPDRRYAYDKSPGGPTREFKAMVKAFHDQGIKVFVDVVYNHTGEGGAWSSTDPTIYNIISFRGLDNPTYYSLSADSSGRWYNTYDNTGCGGNYNTFNPVAQNLIVDSLAYWKDTLGVDGFRFDLASVLGNTCEHGCFNYDKMNAGTALNRIVRDIAPRPDGGGAGVDWISEPWAIGGNSYQVGNFPSGWAEWNGKFRDIFRQDQNKLGSASVTPAQLADHFTGSWYLYGDDGRKPWHSINFMVAHDGFTLRDVYSFNSKVNNLPWPYGPSDGGEDTNNSWDQGGNAAAQRKAARNGLAFLMLSAGTPMITGGDEFFRTQYGNNNAYNLDAYTNWLDYGIDTTREHFKTFTSRLLAFRAAHPALRPANFYSGSDGNGNGMEQHRWFSAAGGAPNWASPDEHAIAFRIDGTEFSDTASAIYVAYNGWSGNIDFKLPWPGNDRTWARVLDTAEWVEGANQVAPAGSEVYQGGENSTYGVNGRSLAVFIAKPICSTPTNLSAVANGEGRIDLSWSGSAASFNILRSRYSGGPADTLIATTTGTSYMDTTVQGGVTYFYMVQAAGACTSPNSNPPSGDFAVSATAQGCGFAGISGVSQLTGGSCGYNVTWSAATGSCSGSAVYNVYRSTTAGFTPDSSNRIAACVSGMSYADTTGLANNTTYYYQVRAENSCGGTEDTNSTVADTYSIPIKCVPSSGNPSPVQFFNVTATNSANILQWVNPASAPVSPFQVRIQSRTDGSYPASPAEGSKEKEIGGQTVSTKGTDSLASTNGTEYRYGIFTDNNAGTVYSGGRFSKGTPFDTSGPVKWRYTTSATALSLPGINSYAGGNSALVVSNDRILHAMNGGGAQPGQWPSTFWPAVMNAPSQARPAVVPGISSLTPGHDRVAFLGAQDGRVYAFDAVTGGTEIWSTAQLGDTIQGGVVGSFVIYGGPSNRLFVGTRNATAGSRFFAIDPKTAPDSERIVWTFDNGGLDNIGIISGSAAAHFASGKVYFLSRAKAGGSSRTAWCVMMASGAPCSGWAPPTLGDFDSSANISGTSLYVGDNDGRVYRLNASTGALESSWTVNPFVTNDGPVRGFVWIAASSNRVYFSTTNNVWALDLTTGQKVWQKTLSGNSPSTPLVLNGRLYTGVYGVTPGMGSLLEIDVTNPASTKLVDLESGAAIGAPGYDSGNALIYVGSEAGTVHAVSVPLP